jgi:3-deoxy-manno-octulosonate cytidylyltransferase (CMP-KDO synthetase)
LDSELVINLQADELLLDPGILDEVLCPFESDPSLQMSTLKREIVALEEVTDPNVVKVVTDHLGNALYFSRSPIPYDRQNPRLKPPRGRDGRGGDEAVLPGKTFYKHLGVYAFRREFLLRFPDLPPSRLEEIEGLEQMRALEAGIRIRVVETRKETLRVDSPDDLEKIRASSPAGMKW